MVFSLRAYRVLAGLWFVFYTSPTAFAAPVRLATHDQAPYGTYLADNSFDGVAVQVVRCVFKRMGEEVSIEVLPWERAQLMAQRGEVDGFFPATIKPERLVWAVPSQMIASQKWVWYLPASSKLDPLSPEFKATAKVGAHFGSNRLKLLEEQQYNVVLKPQSDAQLIQAFAKGRADAILGGDLAIAAAMKLYKIDPKNFREVVVQDSPLHAYFGKKFVEINPEFVKRFDSKVAGCR